jgi:cation-transporting ATPase E
VTLVASLTIGIPGFFLALAPSSERARPGFVPRVLRFAVPAGLICAVATFLCYALARANTASDLEADRSAATLTLFGVAFWALVLVARPFSPWRVAMVATMAAAFILVATVPPLSRIAALSYADLGNDGLALLCAAAGALALTLITRRR